MQAFLRIIHRICKLFGGCANCWSGLAATEEGKSCMSQHILQHCAAARKGCREDPLVVKSVVGLALCMICGYVLPLSQSHCHSLSPCHTRLIIYLLCAVRHESSLHRLTTKTVDRAAQVSSDTQPQEEHRALSVGQTVV